MMADRINRRDALIGIAATGALPAIRPGPAIGATGSSTTAGELAAAIRSGRRSARETVDLHLDRIAAANPRLNAVVQLTADAARREADEADAMLARGQVKGPLHGVPVTIKDTLETAGTICTGGTLGRASYVPKADATAVARLRAAGAIVLGKTNVPELAGALETDNLVYGRTNNPYDLARTPGGSSGGEAAIVAAAGSPLGLGTDAGGSIRVPAHYCGLAALKPTSGRVPRTGQFPRPMGAHNAVFHVSLIARSVDDLALALPIIAGPDFHDYTIVDMPLLDSRAVDLSKVKLAFFDDDGLASPTAEIAAAVHHAVEALALAGVTVTERRPPDAAKAGTIYYDMTRGDGAAGVRAFLKSIGTERISPLFEQSLQSRSSPAMGSITEALAAFNRWDAYRNAMLAFMQDYDALLSPVLPYAAPRHGTSFDDELQKGVGYAQMHNLTGWPSSTVRVGTSPEGLPLGVQVAARPWREDVALALVRQLEIRFGGWTAPNL
ncbi:amidase [Methylobacterium mesophilicum SR1.6/6]|uniref:Amidase n=1 Tax=Methylobacterium mesophilicum SR1.6/6 TaxID=908290 RepID=A0A6B9FIV9_9HYPH|nr:amidase [Methylobacterium mesophilicum]QGY01932.1 amidase [Methylobacterium mesophilicum SR1.6/6]